MKLPSYRSTVGLDSYPEKDRLAIYRATHKQLLQADAVYGRRWKGYVASIIFCIVVPAPAFYAHEIFGTPLLILSLVTIIACAFVLAFRQQNFMNERIGGALLNVRTER